MTEYSVSVGSKMYIDEKNGNVRLEKLKVDSDGYRNQSLLEEGKEMFNEGKSFVERYTEIESGNWRIPLWFYLYYGMLRRLQRWRRR